MIAQNRIPVAAALLLLSLCACRGAPEGDTNIYESGGSFEDARIIEGNAGLAKDLAVLDPRTRYGPGDLMEVQFDLQNNRSRSVAFQWRIDWLDGAGFSVDSNAGTWEPLKLGGGAQTTISAIAPHSEARTWRLQVSSPNEVR